MTSQVIPERVRHIEYNPVTPEAFYVSTGKEPRPKPIGDELGTVIFRYCPTNVTNYVSHDIIYIFSYIYYQNRRWCHFESANHSFQFFS